MHNINPFRSVVSYSPRPFSLGRPTEQAGWLRDSHSDASRFSSLLLSSDEAYPFPANIPESGWDFGTSGKVSHGQASERLCAAIETEGRFLDPGKMTEEKRVLSEDPMASLVPFLIGFVGG